MSKKCVYCTCPKFKLGILISIGTTLYSIALYITLLSSLISGQMICLIASPCLNQCSSQDCSIITMINTTNFVCSIHNNSFTFMLKDDYKGKTCSNDIKIYDLYSCSKITIEKEGINYALLFTLPALWMMFSVIILFQSYLNQWRLLLALQLSSVCVSVVFLSVVKYTNQEDKLTTLRGCADSNSSIPSLINVINLIGISSVIISALGLIYSSIHIRYSKIYSNDGGIIQFPFECEEQLNKEGIEMTILRHSIII